MKTTLLSKTLLVATFIAMLAISSTTFAQVKIGSNPTTIEPTSNLEVEASTPNRKTKVHKVTGQVTIQDGTEGTGKIFTSDAVGGGSWQAPQLVKATVNYLNDGLVTVPANNGSQPTLGNISITFPENGTYALTWAFIADAQPVGTKFTQSTWMGVALSSSSGAAILNHQDYIIPDSFFIFTNGTRYVTITNAPITFQVYYFNSSNTPYRVRPHSGNNYNDWFAYKVY